MRWLRIQPNRQRPQHIDTRLDDWSELKLDTGIGTCSKDGQGILVGVGQPSILIEGLTVGGAV